MLKLNLVLLSLVILILFAAEFPFSILFREKPGASPWMTSEELERYLKPLGKREADGKNFWDRRHWISTIRTRYVDKRIQYRIRTGDAPAKGAYWWYWYLNLSEKSFKRTDERLRKDNFKLVSFSFLELPDGTRKYYGVWHKVAARVQ